MTDYTKATGSGTMMIRDTGTTVELWVQAGSTATWVNGATYGGTWSGSFDYPTGGAWLRLKSTSVTTNITVTFTLNATGTSGLGGPTTLSAAITRDTVPAAPSIPTITNLTTTSWMNTFTDGANGGDAIDTRQLGWSPSSGSGYPVNLITSDGSTQFNGFAPGTTYYVWARTHNSVGWGAWSGRQTVLTLQVPPAPSAVALTLTTKTSVHTVFTSNGSGVGTGGYWELGYSSSSSVAPTSIVTSTGTLDVTGLTPGVVYYFWARGVNSAGAGPWSVRSSTTTLIEPAAPSSVVVTLNKQTTVHTTFTGNSQGVGTFLRWELGYGTSSTTPQTIVTSTGTLDVTGLLPGVTYYFWARGVNSTGNGAWSVSVASRTIAGARVNVAGVWKEAVPYVRVAGVWKVAEGWAKIAGLWKGTG